MIVSRIGGKTSFCRQLSNRDADGVEFSAIAKFKARPACSKSTEQTDESRTEKRDANSDSSGNRPTRNEICPQKRKHEKIAPDHQLEIVPVPCRKPKDQSRDKYCERRQEEGDLLGEFLIPFNARLPHTPTADRD